MLNKLLLLILMLFCFGQAFTFSQEIGIEKSASLDSVKFRIFTFRNSYNFEKAPVFINNDNDYQALLNRTNKQADLWIDFGVETLTGFNYSGVDCYSKFKFALLKDTLNRELVFIVTVINGGCRAGGHSYDGWLIMPKIPKGYSFRVKSIKEDE